MNDSRRPTRLPGPVALLPPLGLLVFILSCQLFQRLPDFTGPTAQRGAADRVFGEARIALGRYCFEKAEVYFHLGVGRSGSKAFQDDFFQRLAAAMRPGQHAHLTQDRTAEMMPWLWLALRFNPEDIEMYRVAAFWLSHAGFDHKALALLQTAQQATRSQYVIQLEKARLLIPRRRYIEGYRAVTAGLAFWPSGTDPADEQARLDRRHLLLYSALLHELAGDTAAAIADYRTIHQIQATPRIAQRIADLLTNRAPSVLASQELHDTLQAIRNERTDHSCGREDHAEGDQAHDHGPGCEH